MFNLNSVYMKIDIKKDDLQKYIEDNKSLEEIATIYSCSKDTIKNRLKEFNIEYKSRSKYAEDLRNKVSTMYQSGMTCLAIGNELRLSEKTILYHLNKAGIKARPQKKINQEDFERLWNEGKSDEEIAKFFEVEVSTVKSYRTKGNNVGKFTRNDYFSEKDIELTEIQEQMILGSLLGDLSIGKTKLQKNANLYIVHSIKQEEYFMKKVEILGDFMGSYKLYTPSPDKRTGKIYKTWRGNSKAHKVFNSIYDILYVNNTKIITQEYLNRINHPIALAYWFMDDGTFRGTLSTHCFSEQEVDLLITWLYHKWNIVCTKQKQLNSFTIYITQESRARFEELILPYVVPSMYYKLQCKNSI